MTDRPAPSTPTVILTWVGLLRAHWKFIGICAGVAVLGSLVLGVLQAPMYQASTTVELSPISSVSSGGGVSDAEIQTELQMLGSAQVVALVTKEIGQVAPTSFAQTAPGSPIIRITSTSATADQTTATANAYAQVFAETVKASDLQRNNLAIAAVQARLDETNKKLVTVGENPNAISTSTNPAIADLRAQQRTYLQQLSFLGDQASFINQGRVRVIDPASTFASTISPITLRKLLIAALLGAIAGAGIIIVREFFNDTVGNAEDFALASGGLTLLGSVPKDANWPESGETRIVLLQEPSSVIAESYRTIRTALQYVRVDQPVRLLQITSPQPQDGKTTTAVNLATAFAATGRKVLLVDLDLRRPRVHKFFDMPNDDGFTNLGMKSKTREQAIVQIAAVPGLSVMVSGPVPANPAELLENKATRDALTSLAKEYDVVIVDSPPILGLSDSLIISSIVDSTILVANSGVAKKRDLRAAVDYLNKVQAPLVGAIVNGVEISKGYGYSYGRYGDSYGSYYSSYYAPQVKEES